MISLVIKFALAVSALYFASQPQTTCIVTDTGLGEFMANASSTVHLMNVFLPEYNKSIQLTKFCPTDDPACSARFFGPRELVNHEVTCWYNIDGTISWTGEQTLKLQLGIAIAFLAVFVGEAFITSRSKKEVVTEDEDYVPSEDEATDEEKYEEEYEEESYDIDQDPLVRSADPDAYFSADPDGYLHASACDSLRDAPPLTSPPSPLNISPATSQPFE